jgi:hypothetical protein
MPLLTYRVTGCDLLFYIKIFGFHQTEHFSFLNGIQFVITEYLYLSE